MKRTGSADFSAEPELFLALIIDLYNIGFVNLGWKLNVERCSFG